MNEFLSADGGLTLRRWRDSDLPAVRDAFNEPGMHAQFGTVVEEGRVDDAAAGRWIARHGERWEQGSAYSWAVTDGTGPGAALLGHVAVSNVNHVHDGGWVSYWTVGAARRRGVASAAVRALSAWCFAELRLFRLELGHRVDNEASCRVALAAGYTVEGRQRAKLRYGTVRHDVETHARLATD
ncbi:GNAT family N-acetyltransferase [Streptomyces triticirhizae]|uniref:N-acetyltransferase n=1 Tax=Streptomyces triticirhizae TaxID=2483353 RepID=A0A3M2LW55_9ACTN|nr:GNAT family protein [Streptomyces triticirhizae]RMI41754.1 N-acetyltransferase [Streptomyces triticirhizae]